MELVQREFSEETKSLYHKDAYTPDACSFSGEVSSIIRPLILKWLAKGHSIRELSLLAHGALFEEECGIILDSQSRKKTLQQLGRDYINGDTE